jgi:hypothetical protein
VQYTLISKHCSKQLNFFNSTCEAVFLISCRKRDVTNGQREQNLDFALLSMLWWLQRREEGLLPLWLSPLRPRRLLHEGRLHKLPPLTRQQGTQLFSRYIKFKAWITLWAFILYLLIQAAILYAIQPETFENATGGTLLGNSSAYAMAIYFSFISDTSTCASLCVSLCTYRLRLW